jgi:hypothetical protein
VGTIAFVCRVVYCLKCKKRAHEGDLCDEEARRTERLMLASLKAFYCPRKECNAGPFSRLEACNHMKCPACKEGHWCAVCGHDISSNVYGHFCNNELVSCIREGCLHCPMFPSI